MINLIPKLSMGVLMGLFLLSSHALPSFAHEDHTHEKNDSITPTDLSVKPTAPAPKTMQNASWTTPKTKIPADTDKADEDSALDIPEDEMTEDQKLWKKYQDLANGSKSKKHKATKATKTPTETPATDKKTSEADSPADTNGETAIADSQEEPMPIGLKGILESYNNAKKNKGKMNSRSFGNID